MSLSFKYGLRAQPPNSYVPKDLNFQIMGVEARDLPIGEMEGLGYNHVEYTSDKFNTRLPVEDFTNEYQRRKCVIHLFGAEQQTGATVCVTVHNFRPVLYYNIKGSANDLVKRLDSILKLNGDIKHKVIQRKRVFGFHPDKENHTEHEKIRVIEVTFPSISKMKGACYKSRKNEPVETRLPEPWESGVDIGSMFMERYKLTPSSWFKMEHAIETKTKKISHCTLEFVVQQPSYIKPVEIDAIAPLLVCSYDLEMYSRSKAFPKAENPGDTISVIGLSFWRVGTPVEEEISVQLVLGECDPIDGVHVECFKTEAELLNGFRDIITVHADVDILTGYNIFGFDNEYMDARAKMTGASRYFYNGRFCSEKTESKAKELESSALGQNRMYPIESAGRCNIDLFNYIKSNHKLPLYGLSPVSEHFIGEKKVDLPYQEMFECVAPEASSFERARAVVYCRGDVVLVIRLMRHLQIIPAMVEMSRVTCSFFNQLVFRGQSVKVMQQITKFAHELGHVVNPVPRPVNVDGYEGAIVHDAKTGFYEDNIATLDFASLYPSIMLAHNLCYSTYVPKDSQRVDGVDYETHTISQHEEYTFARNVKGVITEMLKSLLAARKKAKKQMAAASTPEEKAIYNARQLALKISCNSIYGFTGAEKLGKYPLGAIAKCTTFQGRKLIIKTSELAVELFKPYIAEIIYGDTDSVFVRVRRADGKPLTPAEVFKVGEQVAQQISDSFEKEIELEMEKVYFGFVLMAKKRYFGAMYEPNKQGEVVFSKVDAKGIEIVRRDQCMMLKNLYKKIINALIFDKSPDNAVDAIKSTLDDIIHDKIPYEDYIITKELRKEESYANPKQEQLYLAKKITARTNGGVTPQPGDRIPYVIRYDKNAQHICDKAEDLPYLIENNIPLDRYYYVTNKLAKPILAIFNSFKDHSHLVEKAIKNAQIQIQLQLDKQPTITSFFSNARKRPTPEVVVEEDDDITNIDWNESSKKQKVEEVPEPVEIEPEPVKKVSGFKRPVPPKGARNLSVKKGKR